MEAYFNGIGYPISQNTNPAEFLLDIVSSDFDSSKGLAGDRVKAIQNAWAESSEAQAVTRQVSERVHSGEKLTNDALMGDMNRAGVVSITTALLHRSFIKAYRDVVAYGIRIVMYLGRNHHPSTKIGANVKQDWQL